MSIKVESFPETSRIWFHGEYKLVAYKGAEYGFFLPEFRRLAGCLSASVFKIDPDDASKEVAFNMNNSGSMVIATTIAREETEAVGYSTQRILQPPWESGVRVLYISTRLVRSEHQKSGLGTALLRCAHNLHDAPDIVAGRTQNPAVVRSYDESDLFRKLYPFDETYDVSPRIQRVLDYVALQIKHPTDPVTGLTKGAYKEGKSRSYDDGEAGSEVRAIYNRMINEFGLNSEEGDAIIIMGLKKGRTNFIE